MIRSNDNLKFDLYNSSKFSFDLHFDLQLFKKYLNLDRLRKLEMIIVE